MRDPTSLGADAQVSAPGRIFSVSVKLKGFVQARGLSAQTLSDEVTVLGWGASAKEAVENVQEHFKKQGAAELMAVRHVELAGKQRLTDYRNPEEICGVPRQRLLAALQGGARAPAGQGDRVGAYLRGKHREALLRASEDEAKTQRGSGPFFGQQASPPTDPAAAAPSAPNWDLVPKS